MSGFEERRSKIRTAVEKDLAKLRRILACLTNAIKCNDRPKIEKWQRLLLNYYGIVKDGKRYKERRPL